jgi:hypothetical protein
MEKRLTFDIQTKQWQLGNLKAGDVELQNVEHVFIGNTPHIVLPDSATCKMPIGAKEPMKIICEQAHQMRDSWRDEAIYWLRQNDVTVNEENIYEVSQSMDEAGDEKARDLRKHWRFDDE